MKIVWLRTAAVIVAVAFTIAGEAPHRPAASLLQCENPFAIRSFRSQDGPSTDRSGRAGIIKENPSAVLPASLKSEPSSLGTFFTHHQFPSGDALGPQPDPIHHPGFGSDGSFATPSAGLNRTAADFGEHSGLFPPPRPDTLEKRGEAGGVEMPLPYLSAMAGEEGWEEEFSEDGDNPFTPILVELGRRNVSGGGSSASTNDGGQGSNSGDSSEPPAPEDGSSSSGSGQSSGGGDVDEHEERPQVLLVWRENLINRMACFTQIGPDRFQAENGALIRVHYFCLPSESDFNEQYLLEDFNRDTLTDLLVIGRKEGIYQLNLNNGYGWTPLPASGVNYRIDTAVSFSLLEPWRNDLAFFSRQKRTLEVRENLGNGSFESLLDMSFPTNFDSLVKMDFNRDGYQDLAMINSSQNRIRYIQNQEGRTLRVLGDNLSGYTAPFQVVFYPQPSGRAAKLLWFVIGSQNVLYFIHSTWSVPVATYGLLDFDTCLVIGDFDKNGLLDIGFGRIVN